MSNTPPEITSAASAAGNSDANSTTVTVYASQLCPYCRWARGLLDQKGVAYSVIDVDRDPQRHAEMRLRSGRNTVPQIFIGERHIGGFDDLSALDRAGGLDPLLAAGGGSAA